MQCTRLEYPYTARRDSRSILGRGDTRKKAADEKSSKSSHCIATLRISTSTMVAQHSSYYAYHLIVIKIRNSFVFGSDVGGIRT